MAAFSAQNHFLFQNDALLSDLRLLATVYDSA